MRTLIMQPPYPAKGEALKTLEWQIEALRKIEPGTCDLAVFPENANCTGYADASDMRALITGAGAEFVAELGVNDRTGIFVQILFDASQNALIQVFRFIQVHDLAIGRQDFILF